MYHQLALDAFLCICFQNDIYSDKYRYSSQNNNYLPQIDFQLNNVPIFAKNINSKLCFMFVFSQILPIKNS